MDSQDVNNLSQWLQELLKLMQDTHTQLVDLRNENRQLMDEIRAVSARVDQKDSDILRIIETMRGQVDVVRTEVITAKNVSESLRGHIDSKASDLKSEIHQVRNMIR